MTKAEAIQRYRNLMGQKHQEEQKLRDLGVDVRTVSEIVLKIGTLSKAAEDIEAQYGPF
jgi:hypothetical protein